MSTYKRNNVYDYVYHDVIDVYEDAYISGVYEPVPKSFPAVFIREIGRSTQESSVTFSGEQGVKISTYEVQVQTNAENSSMSDAYSIMETVEKSFQKLFYIQTAMNKIDDGTYGTYRLVGTFRRVVGNADQIPERGE